MSRVVVGIETIYGGAMDLLSLDEPRLADGSRKKAMNPVEQEGVRTFEKAMVSCDPPDSQKMARMQQLGQAVYQLLRSHPVFDTQVAPQFSVRENQPVPLYLRLDSDQPRVLDFPWEAVYSPNAGFLAQYRNFSVARAIESASEDKPWTFRPPLRVMAVLGVNTGKEHRTTGMAQYEALHQRLQESELPYRLKVLSCEKEVVNRIKREARALPLATLETEFLTSTYALREALWKFKPHILHFFCHGTAAEPALLQIATKVGWESGRSNEDFTIEAADLKQAGDADNSLLLVTLACCDGAQGGQRGGALSMSFAQRLVSDGVPAVVGMRRPISTAFADEFSQLFYKDLLNDLKNCVRVACAKGEAEIHWGCALYELRRDLWNNGHAAPCLQWIQPVVYTRRTPFKVNVDIGAPEGRKLLAQKRQLVEAERVLKSAPKAVVKRIAQEHRKVDVALKAQRGRKPQ